ncbi:MAG: B12-binding domain-containing radical SAM protein, partial [Clostridia bacterium]|nr:B12-binding domain-containing radical SAM protein [Clostridia bacterium]
MKVLFINPSVGYYTRALSNPLGLLSIATYVKNNGHQVKLEDRCVNKANINKLLDSFKPDIVGVSLMSSRGLVDAAKVSKAAKAKGIPVVWGGQMPSMQIEEVLLNDFVDYVSYGEGEETWLEMLNALEKNESFSEIQGLAYTENGKTVITPCRKFADLRDMPVSDYTLIDPPKYMQTYLGCKKMMYVYSSKGCPCRCAFCSNQTFHKSTHRKRPNDIVLSEVKYLIDNYGVDGIYFSDELWCIKRSDLVDFCQRVHDMNLNFHWGIEMRIGMFEEEDYQMLYDAGCRWILFGIETGSKEMQEIIHKNIDYSKIAPTFEVLNRIGITTIASFIIGFPNETTKQLKDTVRLLNTVKANLTPVFHFTPLPGTELYNQVVANGTYKAPRKLKDMSKVVATESLGVNLSAVPSVDLRVIRSWYLWKSFSNKSALQEHGAFEFAKETILNGLHSISLKGPVSFLIDGFKALYEFLYIFWYSHA